MAGYLRSSATRSDPILDAVLTIEGSMGGSADTSASDAAAWSHTAEQAARKASFMYAQRAAMTPASRSPIPPIAMKGLPASHT